MQFLVVLIGTDPLVWRRILVPVEATFWDLHVAIQDAMGWRDEHLHEFTFRVERTGRYQRIGIPDPDFGRKVIAGWTRRIGDLLDPQCDPLRYLYDFGDGWCHTVECEDVCVIEGDRPLPVCLAGAGACPPENAGGVHGYAELLRVRDAPGDSERDEFFGWLKEDWDEHAFDPAAVTFDDPEARWERAFGDDDPVRH
jgi:hypothetical protein